MSEKPKQKAEFFKMKRSKIDWSDPETVSEAMQRIYEPFDFDRKQASETDDSPPVDGESANDSTESTIQQDV